MPFDPTKGPETVSSECASFGSSRVDSRGEQLPAPDTGYAFYEFVPSPPAATDWRYINRYEFPVWLLSVFFRFTTSAVVANRLLGACLYSPSGARVQGKKEANTQAQSIQRDRQYSRIWYFADQNTQWAVGQGVTFGGLPIILIPEGWSYGTESVDGALQAGDQMSMIALLLQRAPKAWSSRG